MIERNFTGFEMGDLAELIYGTGGSVSLSTIVDDSTARSGRFHFRQTASAGGASLASFPAGGVVGTSGTVSSGNHKRVSLRAYLRVESGGANNGQQRIVGFGNDTGTCSVFFGAQNTAGGFTQAGSKIGLRIGAQSHNNIVGAYPWGTVDLTAGVWYRLLLDIDLDVAGTTVLSASLQVTEDSDAPSVDFTLTNSLNIGATDNLDALAFGYSTVPGAFGKQATVQWDDVVYIGTSDADAVSAATLPTQTHIYAIVPPTGVVLNEWTGTYTAVDEYPVSGVDTMSSSTASAEVEFSHASGIALGYLSVEAMKLYVNALVSGGGTGSVDYMLNGVAKNVVLGANYPGIAFGADPIGGLLWSTLTAAAFGATTFGIKKQNGTQATSLANIGIEVLATLAEYGSGNQIRGETQIKRGTIFDAQISDTADIQRHKIQGLGGGAFPVFFPEEDGRDDWLIPGPKGSDAAVRIPATPIFFPDEAADSDAMMMPGGGSTSSGSSPHALLDGVQNNDTTAASPTKGSVISSDGSTWREVLVGADGQVLTADSTQADGVKWAAAGAGTGAMVQLQQIVTSASQATVDFTSISAAYTTLIVKFHARDTQGGTASVVMRVRLNNDSTAANYTATAYSGQQNGAGLNSTLAASTSGVFCMGNPQDGNTAGITCAGELSLIGYAGTTFHKRIYSAGAYDDATTNITVLTFASRWKSTAAINRITFLTDGTAFKDGSVFTLYGVL